MAEEKLKLEPKRSASSATYRTISERKTLNSLLEKKSTLEELEEILRKRAEVLENKMAVLQEIDAVSNQSDSCSNVSSRSRTQEWVQNQQKEPSGRAPETSKFRPNGANAPSMSSSCETDKTSRDDENVNINKLASVIQQTFQKRHISLPNYDGKSSEWLLFKSSYHETADRYEPAENLLRLRLALKGDARTAVAALLHSSSDPDEVLRILSMRFGRPSKIIKDQINIITNLKTNDLNILASEVCNCVATIKTLKMYEFLNDIRLYESIIAKFSDSLCEKWIDFANKHNNDSTLVSLADFLKREAESRQRFLPDAELQSSSSTPGPAAQQSRRASAKVYKTVSESTSCAFCSSTDHKVGKCNDFIKMNIDDRMKWAKDNRKCFRCLQFSHIARNCRIAKGLHMLLRKPKNTVDDAQNVPLDDVNVSNVSCTQVNTVKNLGCILKVVPVTVRGPKGSLNTYALLDEGATISLLESNVAKIIGVDGPTESLNIEGVGSSKQMIHSKSVSVCIQGKSQDSQFNVQFRTMDNLNLQTQHLNKTVLISHKHIKEVEHLVDWYHMATPMMLIGQDNWHLIISRKLYMGGINEPLVSETLLGHVVHGSGAHRYPALVAHVQAHSSDDDLHSLVKRSFELDSIGIVPKQRANPVEERALDILTKTTKKVNNTWETGLLWAKDDVQLPDSSSGALKRFYNLEIKFKKDPILAQNYSEQINRLIHLGYAEQCHEPLVDGNSWVLPHFAVTNPNKPNKVRVVFDASAKSRGVSLNDNLLTGPDLLQSLLGVLWKFRQAPVAMAADIKDMFLRIKIRKGDQNFQRFYWRELGDNSLPKLYTMTSMLFGASCSPSSAIFVKNRNAQDFSDEYPDAVRAIHQNHYMDDYLDCCSSESEAIEKASNIINIHASGGFNICNWASNSAAVLQSIPADKRAHGEVQLTPDAAIKEKTLGIMWQPSTDMLSFNLSMNRVPGAVSSGQDRPTKRQMLSVIMSIFDPIGLLSPISVRGKMLLQEVWHSSIGWDDKLLDLEFKKWQNWLVELRRVKSCAIPRCYISRNDSAVVQLHTFCDASMKAYAAVSYLRFLFSDGDVGIALVAAKSRVAPRKPVSVPRLELQAALLGARLAHTVVTEHDLQISEKYFWSDSITTLAWIGSDPRKYKPYVAHRLAAIDDLTMVSQWKWVPTEYNPADIPTRENSVLDWSPDGQWFSGPDFLKKQVCAWPFEKVKMLPAVEASCEEKHQVHALKVKEYSLPDIAAFSSWRRLIRATAYVLLFLEKIKNEYKGGLTLQLLNNAENLWIRKVQEDCYIQELECLKNNHALPSNSKLLQLTPVLDDDGIIRLGGRIDRVANVEFQVKRPVILSGSHTYTKLLIEDYHKRFNHASTETVLNELRQKFWIPKIRSTVKSVAIRCQLCKIRKAKAIQPPMGDLPDCRLQHHKRPFSFCGLDYFGPIEVTIGRRHEKRWCALFTCLVTRAVHMEVAGSLTADAVIMAIRRMIARRGCPTAIYSDNGTNFKGADAELKRAWLQVDRDAISDDMLNRKIEWHWIPATAAYMGGAWERLVQSIKKALRSTLHSRAPREEVLHTLLLEAELTVNSRPLTHVSIDPRDGEALTPNHFLIGSSSAAPIPGVFDDKDLMLRKQWKVSQRLADIFWNRWVKEYLPGLIDRKMKNTADQQVKEGCVVIVADNTLPRNMWPRGIITKIFPGKDNKVRVVDVQTAGGIFRRPVNKIIILPVDSVDTASNNYVGSSTLPLEII